MEAGKRKWEKLHDKKSWEKMTNELWKPIYQLCSSYDLAIKQSQTNQDELWKQIYQLSTAYNILKRGYCICEVDGQKDEQKDGQKNRQKNILIVGINPSYPEKPGPPTYLLTDTNKKKPYWRDVARMLKDSSNDLYDKAAYIDVFSCQESDQKTVENAIIRNTTYLLQYIVTQVEATQEIIETVIQPKVIIIKNRLAWAFFGKDECTWMGYTFEKIDQFNDFEVCKITGFSDKEDRINKSDFKDTNLKGSIVVFAIHNYKHIPDFYPTPEKINQWVAMAKLNKQ